MIPLPLLFRGKVRDVYAVPGGDGGAPGLDRDDHAPGRGRDGPRDDAAAGGLLLLVASDRVSAFDVVMDEPVPGKGRVLTQITAWWLNGSLSDVPHHLVSVRTDEIRAAVPALAGCEAEWADRASLVRRTRPLAVECVVRGHLSGSAWNEYRESGTLAGEPLPRGLVESDALVPAVFSPATKVREGHDENITFDAVIDLLGAELAHRVRDRSIDIFERGRAAAARRGIILADTKFEFGLSAGGKLLLIDEVLTPDSSRFWPRERYRVGRSQPSIDKQPLRDYLNGLTCWQKQYPPPPLPAHVVDATAERYRGVFERLTGVKPETYEPPRFGGAPGGGTGDAVSGRAP